MPDTTATTNERDKIAGDHVIEIAQEKAPKPESEHPVEEVSLATVKKPRTGLLHGLSKLKPLLPILSGGLRLIDHGAAQAVAQLLYLAGTGNSQTAAEEELQQGLAEIESSHRDLHHQVQDQTVELQRIQDQITLLRETVEGSAARHADLVDKMRSLNNLVWIVGAAFTVLLVVLIVLIVFLLIRRP